MNRGMSWTSLSLAIALGVLGGTVLVLSFAFFTPGKDLLITYTVVILATTAVIRAEGLASWFERFAAGLIPFIIASLALYVAVAVDPHSASISFLGHAWRLALLVGVGVAINFATARVAASPIHATGVGSAT
jgi:hypothetical protein